MTLKEKNNVLRLALDSINYIVSENAGNNPDPEDVEKQYDCNKLALDAIAKVLAGALRLEVFDGDISKSTYFTQEAAREFAKAQKDIMDGKSLNETLANPPMGAGNFRKFLTFEKLDIEFKRFVSKESTKLVAQWRDELNSHIYEITVLRGTTGWIALAQNDGHHVFDLHCKNRSNAEHLALSAMKRYLARSHRKRLRTLRAAETKAE